MVDAMGYCRALVELNRDTLIPEDLVVNTWHFITPGSVADAAADLTVNIDAFYTSIGSLLASSLTGTGTIKYYDMEDPEPRSPVATGSVVFTTANNSLPGEVALVLSFQGPLVSGANQSRRRGRLFIGPLGTAVAEASTGDVRPTASARNTLVTAAEALMDDTSLPGLIWTVFSPTTAGPAPWSEGALEDAMTTVTNGWVNDAFDTMRSRGLRPSARTIFPVP